MKVVCENLNFNVQFNTACFTAMLALSKAIIKATKVLSLVGYLLKQVVFD